MGQHPVFIDLVESNACIKSDNLRVLTITLRRFDSWTGRTTVFEASSTGPGLFV